MCVWGGGCFALFIWGGYMPSLIPLGLWRIPLSSTPLWRVIVRSWVLIGHGGCMVSERSRSLGFVCRTLISIPALSRNSSSGLALPEVFIRGCLYVGIVAVGKGVVAFK